MLARKSKIIIGELKFLVVLLGIFLVLIFSAVMEGFEVLVAGTASDSINVSVAVLDAVSLSSPADVTLSSDILGTGSATGSATWNVSNNSSSSWQLELEASTSPALTSDSDSFADYTEAVAGVPEAWSVASTDSEFGFSAAGDASEAKYSSGTKFEGFAGSSKIKVAGGSGSTPGGGEDITIHFKAEVGVDQAQDPDNYSAVITATASTL